MAHKPPAPQRQSIKFVSRPVDGHLCERVSPSWRPAVYACAGWRCCFFRGIGDAVETVTPEEEQRALMRSLSWPTQDENRRAPSFATCFSTPGEFIWVTIKRGTMTQERGIYARASGSAGRARPRWWRKRRSEKMARGMPEFKNMKTWTDRFGHTALRSFTDGAGHFWLEQNAAKASKWARLAREGHELAWEFDAPGGAYTGLLLIDGEIFTPREATKRFFQPPDGKP